MGDEFPVHKTVNISVQMANALTDRARQEHCTVQALIRKYCADGLQKVSNDSDVGRKFSDIEARLKAVEEGLMSVKPREPAEQKIRGRR